MEQNKNEMQDQAVSQKLLYDIIKDQNLTDKELKLNEMNNLSRLMEMSQKEENINQRHAETLLAKLVEGEDDDD
jgi:hypothetical protein